MTLPALQLPSGGLPAVGQHPVQLSADGLQTSAQLPSARATPLPALSYIDSNGKSFLTIDTSVHVDLVGALEPDQIGATDAPTGSTKLVGLAGTK